MNRAVGALGQSFTQGLRYARRTGADHDYLAAMLFTQLQGFFERVGVRFVDLEAEVVFFDPGAGGVDAQRRIAERNLLNRNCDFHQSFLKIRQPLVPPKPKELESAYSIGMDRA